MRCLGPQKWGVSINGSPSLGRFSQQTATPCFPPIAGALEQTPGGRGLDSIYTPDMSRITSSISHCSSSSFRRVLRHLVSDSNINRCLIESYRAFVVTSALRHGFIAKVTKPCRASWVLFPPSVFLMFFLYRS